MSLGICIHHQLLMKYFPSCIIFIAVPLNLSNLSGWERERESMWRELREKEYILSVPYHRSFAMCMVVVQANCSAIKGIVLFYLMPFCFHINFQTIGNVLRFIKKQQCRNTINGSSVGGGGDGGSISISINIYLVISTASSNYVYRYTHITCKLVNANSSTEILWLHVAERTRCQIQIKKNLQLRLRLCVYTRTPNTIVYTQMLMQPIHSEIRTRAHTHIHTINKKNENISHQKFKEFQTETVEWKAWRIYLLAYYMLYGLVLYTLYIVYSTYHTARKWYLMQHSILNFVSCAFRSCKHGIYWILNRKC